MTRLLIALIAAVLAPAAAAAQTAPPIAFGQRTLANGLRVISAVDRTATDVSVQVWYGVGAKDDPPGRSGFAHLFEHLMFKAAGHMPAEYLDRLTEDVGGFNNASTADDYTEYHEVVPAGHLQRLLWAEAERMGALVVDEANFRSEREVVKEELRQTVLADPYGRLESWAIPAATFSVHPYKRSVIGSIEDLDAAALKDVRAFHATYYRPDNAALIVVGNFDQAALDAWVDAYFVPLNSPKTPMPRVTVREPPRTGPRTVIAHGPNVPLPSVAVTWLGPAAASDDAAALTVADALLSLGESSRLNRALVHDRRVASSVASAADLRQQPGMVMVSGVVAGGRTAGQLEAALRAEVGRLRDTPVGPAELAKAKALLVAGVLRERETVEDRAAALGYALAVEGDPARANDDIRRLQAVTAADVRRVARLYLRDDRRAVIRYLPGAPAPGGAAVPTPAAAAPGGAVPAPIPAPPPVGPVVQAVLPAPVERTLDNGLRVIVARSSDLPLVSARLTVRGGGAADPPGKAGLADMTASMLTLGAGGRSAAQAARDIEALGARLDSDAGWDGASTGINVTTDRLKPALALLADAVRRPTFAEVELAHLRRRTLDGLTVELQEPGALARHVADAALFPGGPYGHVLGGDPASLRRIGRGDVIAFHRAYYRPDNAVLVLTGDVTPEAGFALAREAFGGWARPPGRPPGGPPPVRSAGPPAEGRVIVVDVPGADQAAVVVALPAIARLDPRYYPALVANSLLGGGYSARLNQEVRIKRGLSYGARSDIDARRLPGPLVAAAQTKTASAPEVVDLILAEIARLGREPAGDGELAARKAVLTGGFGRSAATADGLAGQLGALALLDAPLTELARFQAGVEAVSPGAARAFAAQVLDPARAVVVVVGDARIFTARLKARFPELEVIPAAALNLDSPKLREP